MSRKNSKPVIFLAFANEQGGVGHQGYLRKLPEELRHLEAILERAEDKGLCELVIKHNATLEQVLAVFQDADYRDRVAIFHYGGHASSTGLYLESDDEHAREASAEGLAEFLGQQDGLELVFLNGCSTRDQARGLLNANVSAVIATSQAIDDDVATAFAGFFYSGLAGGATLQAAFNEAEGAVVSDRGADPSALYRHLGGAAPQTVVTEQFPWRMYVRPGSETTLDWNLPDAADDPLLGLPELPDMDLPERPYRQLNYYTEQDAELFFGRGFQIRELYFLLADSAAPPIVLYCGQSGVGKSSLLNAGLIPRLKRRDPDPHEVRAFRRSRAQGLASMFSEALGAETGIPLLDAWTALESATGQPVTVIADQIEEVFTRPNADHPGELEEFLDALIPVYARVPNRPRGKLVLSFRKEWVQDIKRRLEERKLPHAVRYLETLDRRGIVEAIEGPASSPRLRQKYELSIEPGLAETMAVQLLADSEAAVAPTLQIRLGRMWESAGSPPRFDMELYDRLQNEGFGLDQYLDQEFALLSQNHAGVVESGLALDVLSFHTTPRGTAEARSEAELEDRYARSLQEVQSFVAACKRRFLLIAISSKNERRDEGSVILKTRLAHDTLAPLVRERFDRSNKRGQRARRILENRAVDWKTEPFGDPLDEADLRAVEQGERGMRDPDEAERRLIAASIEARGKRRRKRNIYVAVLVVLMLAIVISVFISYLQGKKAIAQGQRAQVEALRVRAAGITTLADLQEEKDPLLASLLLSSLRDDEEPKGAVQVALGVAQKPIPLDIMTGHTDDVNSIACSPDHKAVVTASSDKSAMVWDIGGAAGVIPLDEHDLRLNGAIFNPNSRQVVTWSDDGKVYMQLAHGEDAPRLVADHRKGVETVQFHPLDDTLLMTASDDGTVNIWNVGGGGDCLPVIEEGGDGPPADGNTARAEPICKVRVLKDDGAAVRSASFSPDGAHIAAVSESGALALWRVDRSGVYRPYAVEFPHLDQIMDAVFSPLASEPGRPGLRRSSYLVTTSRDKSATRWKLDFDSEEPQLTDPLTLSAHSEEVNTARFSPDGQRILTVSDDRSAIFWDPVQPSGYVRLCGHDDGVVSAQFSGNGDLIVTASVDGKALVWSRPDLEEHLRRRLSAPVRAQEAWAENPDCLIRTTPVQPLMVLRGHQGGLTGAAFCGEKDRFVVTASRDDTVRLWDLTRGVEPLILAQRKSPAVSVAINWDGQWVAAAFESDPGIVIHREGEPVKTLDQTRTVDFLPEARAREEGNYVLTTSQQDPPRGRQRRIREWPVEAGAPATKIGDGLYWTAVYGPKGDRFITSGWSPFTQVWDANGRLLECCGAVTDRSFYAELSHDGTGYVLAMTTNDVLLGRAPGSGGSSNPSTIFTHDASVTMAVYSPDDRLIASASGDNTIRITPVDGIESGRTLAGHAGTVTSVAFSPDGRLLVSGSDDGTARIWNVDGTGEPIVLKAGDSAIRSVRFTPDGRRVVTGSNDGAVRVWRFLWEDVLQYLEDSTRICLTMEERMDLLSEDRQVAAERHGACREREQAMAAGGTG